jgi:sugar fermentation stimulation protein
MKYAKIRKAKFIDRPNRFIARVDLGETAPTQMETVHVRNTGRCREILIPGVTVFLEEVDKPDRKTRFSLISAYKDQRLINIDSQIPNPVVAEAIRNRVLAQFEPLTLLKAETAYGESRFDFYYETQAASGFIEVKGVTLEQDEVAMFPDAPTERGAKHLHELMKTVAEGYRSYVLFLIQMKGVKHFRPNEAMDPGFANALKKAAAYGVEVLAYDSIITPDGICLSEPVPVQLP